MIIMEIKCNNRENEMSGGSNPVYMNDVYEPVHFSHSNPSKCILYQPSSLSATDTTMDLLAEYTIDEMDRTRDNIREAIVTMVTKLYYWCPLQSRSLHACMVPQWLPEAT